MKVIFILAAAWFFLPGLQSQSYGVYDRVELENRVESLYLSETRASILQRAAEDSLRIIVYLQKQVDYLSRVCFSKQNLEKHTEDLKQFINDAEDYFEVLKYELPCITEEIVNGSIEQIWADEISKRNVTLIPVEYVVYHDERIPDFTKPLFKSLKPYLDGAALRQQLMLRMAEALQTINYDEMIAKIGD